MELFETLGKALDPLSKKLTCTQCGDKKETYSDLVYSQGSLVCGECKKINSESDKKAFDRYITNRREIR